MSKALSSIERACLNVFGEVIDKVVENALEFIWLYDEAYPGESDAAMEMRLDMTSPGEGSASELATHLKMNTDLRLFMKMFITDLLKKH